MSEKHSPLFKQAILLLASSGILINAVYIFGRAFYEGYIESFGFDSTLFEMRLDNSAIWTYHASRHLSSDIILFVLNHKMLSFILVLIAIITIFLCLVISNIKIPKEIINKIITLLNKFTFTRKIKNVVANKTFIFTILSSYLALSILYLVCSILLFWLIFPDLGSSYGKTIATRNMTKYDNNLCNTKSNKWTSCITITSEENKKFTGRVIVKKDNLIGIYTKNGPVTITLPKIIFYQNTLNPNYKK